MWFIRSRYEMNEIDSKEASENVDVSILNYIYSQSRSFIEVHDGMAKYEGIEDLL